MERAKALERRETGKLTEILKTIDDMKPNMEKVKVEGAKESFKKIVDLINLLKKDRDETRIAWRKALDEKEQAVVRLTTNGDLAKKLEISEGNIIAAIENQKECFRKEMIEMIEPPETHTGGATEDKNKEEMKWTDIVKRNVKATKEKSKPGPTVTKPKMRAKPPAIMVNVAKEDFPALAKKIRDNVNGDTIGNRVIGMHQAKAGGLLIEIRGNQEDMEKVRAEISRSAGPEVEVRSLQQRRLIEIRDMDEWTTKEEALDAILRVTGTGAESIKILSLRKTYGGSQAAVVSTSIDAAEKLLKEERIRVGWISCRVREAENKLRCFRCLAIGHMSKDCNGPDRSHSCRRCGEQGHKAFGCPASTECIKAFEKTLAAGGANKGVRVATNTVESSKRND